jgi:hypothetical protein
MEGFDFAKIAQRAFVLSFWVKSTKTGTFCVGFRNSGTDRSYVGEYTVSSSDTWEFKTISVSASPSAGTWNYTNGVGLVIDFVVACGSTLGSATAGSWASANYIASSNQVNGMDSTSNDFKIALIKIEPGTSATAFTTELVADVIVRCRRYYEKTYNINTYPGATTTVGLLSIYSPASGTQTPWRIDALWQVEKRSAPTLTYYNESGTSGVVNRGGNLTRRSNDWRHRNYKSGNGNKRHYKCVLLTISLYC